jgi:hypothetical protein
VIFFHTEFKFLFVVGADGLCVNAERCPQSALRKLQDITTGKRTTGGSGKRRVGVGLWAIWCPNMRGILMTWCPNMRGIGVQTCVEKSANIQAKVDNSAGE